MAQTRRTPGAGEYPGGSSEVIAATEVSVADRADAPRVVGRWIAPDSHRRWWWVDVDCPRCLQQHRHTDVARPPAPGTAGWVRHCPTSGESYEVVTSRGWVA